MTNERIGSFLAQMRKQREMTQEQLAERLGVSNRSVSRWENGKTLPDISLMEDICRVLDISLPELLRGEKETADMGTKEAVALVAVMAQGQRRQKAKEVNGCLIPGAVLLGLGFWHPGLAVMGMGLVVMGIIRNSREQILTDREVDVLAATGNVQMRTAGEMVQYVRKHQGPELQQQRKALEAIARALEAEETAVFAMTGSSCQWDGKPGPWHIALAVTQKRVLLCGEHIRGRLMTGYTPEWLEREEIRAVDCQKGKLFLRGEKNVVCIAGKDMKVQGEKLKKLLGK